MKLYVTRHGQTEWNVLNKVCGLTDIPLTEEGIRQAEELAKKLTDIKIDYIVASPLIRARKTAEIIASTIDTEIIFEERLMEQNYGKFEGALRDDPDYLKAKFMFSSRMPEGESILQLTHRIYQVLDEIKEKHKEKTILIVAHGSVTRILHTYFCDLTEQEFFNYLIGNCELKEYHF